MGCIQYMLRPVTYPMSPGAAAWVAVSWSALSSWALLATSCPSSSSIPSKEPLQHHRHAPSSTPACPQRRWAEVLVQQRPLRINKYLYKNVIQHKIIQSILIPKTPFFSNSIFRSSRLGGVLRKPNLFRVSTNAAWYSEINSCRWLSLVSLLATK